MFIYDGKGSEGRQLGSARIVWKQQKSTAWYCTHFAFQKKYFLYKIITGDEKWILYDNPKCRKSWIDSGQPSGQPLINIDANAQYPRHEGFARYLMGKERCVVLRVVTEWNNYGRRLPTTIDNFAMHSKKRGHLLAKDIIKWFCFITMLDHILRKRFRTISLR